MKKYLYVGTLAISSFFIFSIGVFADAASDATEGINKFSALITLINNTIVRSLGTLFMGLAVVAFFFGLVQYIWGLRQGDVGKSKVGNQFMGWGLVALFVMFSVYGIIKFGQGIIFNGTDVTTIGIPTINAGGTGAAGGSPGGGGGTGGATGGSPLGGGTGGGNPGGGGGAAATICTADQPCSPTGGGNGMCNGAGTACVPVSNDAY